MFLASAASTALLARCSRCRWSLSRLSRAGSSPIRSINLPNSSRLHTISIDGDAFAPSNSSLSEVVETLPKNHTVNRKLSSSENILLRNEKFQRQIQQWISSNPRIAPYKAEESLARLWVEQQSLFRQWQHQHEGALSLDHTVSSPNIIFTTESVNFVLQAWCFSNNGEIAAERAERMLHWVEDLHSPESALASFLPKPDYQSYATVIDAWSRAAVYESAHANSVNSETQSGGRAIPLSTKAGFECAKRAEDVLMHMQRMHEKQLQSEAEIGRYEHYNSEIQPDTRVFNLVLTAWSKIRGGTKASAIRAMRILDLMQELHHYQSMNAPGWQGIVLSKVQPNLQTYKLVLHAWAYAAHTVEGPDRAEEILRHMLSLSKAGNMGVEIMPDVECFHIVMKAHAECVRKKRKADDGSEGRAQKVTSLLDWMELLSLRRSKIQPTTESYRIALSAWVWSHHVDAPKEAERILRRMIRARSVNRQDQKKVSSYNAGAKKDPDSWVVQPETRDFNTVINCCSFARKVGSDKGEEDDDSMLERQLVHQEIFDVAEGVLHALLSSSYVQPDSATFSGIIRACLNLLPNTAERDERVIDLFRLAYRTPPAETTSAKISSTPSERMQAPPGAGCVDANVLRQLRLCLPSTEDYIRVREEFEEYRRQNVQG
ncbi:hypothetical protein ACHAW5_004252 [Stephanodiscus triporus]|uniref:Uncharacterized protein n=1 Tax=Stephanodiscus triporus TaxID=2934178 RepID=A0ABD3MCM1_9STRA